jgi:hypothetical protein
VNSSIEENAKLEEDFFEDDREQWSIHIFPIMPW